MYGAAQDRIRKQFPNMAEPLVQAEALKQMPPGAVPYVTNPFPGGASKGGPAPIEGGAAPPTQLGALPDVAVLKAMASDPSQVFAYLQQNYPDLLNDPSRLLPILEGAGINPVSVANDYDWIDWGERIPLLGPLGTALKQWTRGKDAAREKAAAPFWRGLSKKRGG